MKNFIRRNGIYEKTISAILIFALILSFSFTAYASVGVNKNDIKIKLPLSLSENDKIILNSPMVEKGNNQYFEFSTSDKNKYNDNSNILLTIKDIKIEETYVDLSGIGQFFLGHDKYDFNFESVQLNVIETSNGKTIYDGVIETKINDNKYEEIPCILDVTFLDDFSKGTISMTLGELDDEKGIAMIFWGDVFPEQQEVYNLNKKNNNNNKGTNLEDSNIKYTTQDLGIMSAPGYDHVGNANNKSIGGSTTTSEMVVISVSKADFRDRQSDLGNEMIRIFSRSDYVADEMTGVLLAQPTSIEAIFQSSTSNFLDITQTTPRSGNNAISFEFPILEYLYPAVGPVLSYVNLLIENLSSTSVTLSDTLGDGHYNKAVVKSNITTGYSNVDLPSSTAYSSAHYNEENGVSVEIDYSQRPDAGYSGTVTSKARITYRLYLNTDRTSSATTGYASYSHVVYGY